MFLVCDGEDSKAAGSIRNVCGLHIEKSNVR